MRALLDTEDPMAISWLGSELRDRGKRHSTRFITEDETSAANRSLDLIECDLGRACGPDSMRSLLGCLYAAEDCGLDFEAQVMRRETPETPETQRTIEDDRVLFLDAIRSRNYSLWGL
jgi:hypothetical protein